MRAFEQMLKVLADEKRLRIVMMLQVRAMCVCELAAVLGVSQPSVSRHLNRLCAVGLLGCRKSGLWTDYFLTLDKAGYPDLMRLVGKNLKHDPRVLKDRNTASALDRSQLCACRG